MGFGLAWLGFLDLTWVLQDLGPLIFYNRWVLHDLVLNKYGCTRLPAGCLGGYCFGSVGLDVFGLWEISCILRLSRVVGGYLNSFFLLLLGTLGFLFGGKLQQWLLFYNWKKTLCLPAGYWIFIPFILFHFIGLVTVVVLGFVRVPVLSRHVISIVVQLSPRCRKLKHYIFPISLEL
ncbi:hypothetical protein NC651_029078 [Populus alba x Populus x berolinensis]|nr:hypothetical protein NC651_029078 [Populus alba x Populus x berolinensis]